MSTTDHKTETSNDTELNGAEVVLERDNWECQVCGFSPPEDSDQPMFTTLVGHDETNPDHFQTRCRQHHVDYVSDDPPPNFAPPNQQAGAEQMDSRSVEKQSSNHPLGRAWNWYSNRFYWQFLAMLPISVAIIFGGGITIGGVTMLNPFRMMGMSTWPVQVYPNRSTITAEQYLTDITTEAPVVIAVGVLILVVCTQLAIWIEPKNGFATRITKWTIQKVKSRL